MTSIGERIWGRGSWDDKSGLIGIMYDRRTDRWAERNADTILQDNY